MERLPEFRVVLERVEGQDERTAEEPHYDRVGRRTKFGGVPDGIQTRDFPTCPGCKKQMVFVSQIDSIEHDESGNPHRVNCLSDDQKWVFGDVWMIYVFFCFECLQTKSILECA